MTVLTAVPDFRVFHSPRQLMSYIGVVPGESSSGEMTGSRPLTKTGNNLLRYAFTNAALQYTMPLKTGGVIRKQREGLDPEILEVVERADRRCRMKYNKLISRGVIPNKAKAAVARELAGFVWAAMMIHYKGELREPCSN